MDTLYHQTNDMLNEIEQTLQRHAELESKPEILDLEQEIQAKIYQANTKCSRLEVMLPKLPVSQQKNTKLRIDQLKYDLRFMQRSFSQARLGRQKRQREELEAQEEQESGGMVTIEEHKYPEVKSKYEPKKKMSKKGVQCPKCGVKYTNNSDADAHKDKCVLGLQQKRLVCEKCKKSFTYRSGLHYHRPRCSGREDIVDVQSTAGKFLRDTLRQHLNPQQSGRYFIYILLDLNEMSVDRSWSCFLDAVFYIGIGNGQRPLHHFEEAFQDRDGNLNSMDDAKIAKIWEIWDRGEGVGVIENFQNCSLVEAENLEASAIQAIGPENITNTHLGSISDIAQTWSEEEVQNLGTHVLMAIFLKIQNNNNSIYFFKLEDAQIEEP